jgi:hypothetical protein
MRNNERALEPVFRALTHINMGAALAMVLWIFWSGTQIVSGRWEVPIPPASHTPTTSTPAPCPVHGSVAIPFSRSLT